MLVIAPLRVAEDTWARETEKWDHLHHLRISKILGTKEQRRKALNADADIWVTSRDLVVDLVEHYGSKWPFDMVVIDESSSFKNPQSKRFRALRRVRKLMRRVVILTGTPGPKGLLDLWSQLYLLDQGERLETTLGRYREKYFSPGARRGHVVFSWSLKPGAEEAIHTRISDICISMRTEDYLDLPPITFNRVAVTMNRKERRLYDALKRDKVLTMLEGKELDSAVVGATAAALSNKLLQMSGGAVYDEDGGVVHIHDRKLDALGELVEAAQGQPVLVFYAYKHEAERIKAKFKDAVALDRSADTVATIKAWNGGDIPLLLCHPASAGHGLNLQGGGHIIVWYGLPWSLELYQQANARLHRMGQTDPVIVHHIVCEDTLDDRVLAVLGQREADQNSLIEALRVYIEKEQTP